MGRDRITIIFLLFLTAGLLLHGRAATIAEGCENPWGKAPSGSSAGSGVVTPEDVQLCLPPGFIPDKKDGGFAFYDPNDNDGKKGRLGLAVINDSKYRAPDKDEEYERIKVWLCNLANSSMGTSCSITRLQGGLFVVLKGLEIGSHTESYFHMGNGYLLALTAEAQNDETLASLRSVIQEVRLP